MLWHSAELISLVVSASSGTAIPLLLPLPLSLSFSLSPSHRRPLSLSPALSLLPVPSSLDAAPLAVTGTDRSWPERGEHLVRRLVDGPNVQGLVEEAAEEAAELYTV